MDEEAKTKAIEEWLRMVDKPLAKKEPTKQDGEPREGMRKPEKETKGILNIERQQTEVM